MDKNKTLRILGTRGVPARHGGFETFAEHLALYLTRRGWNVIVYCQDEGEGKLYEDEWRDIRLIRVPIKNKGALGTILFDWKTTLHTARHPGGILTLGYNTAIFCVLYRLLKLRNVINMDGLEWQREKWSLAARLWLYINERIGCLTGNHLIADHPEIQNHLATRVRPGKITMIPYGAESIDSADQALLEPYGLRPQEYAIVIARPEFWKSSPGFPGVCAARNWSYLETSTKPIRNTGRRYFPQPARKCFSRVLFMTSRLFSHCAISPAFIFTVIRSAAPIRRWSKRLVRACRYSHITIAITAGWPATITISSPTRMNARNHWMPYWRIQHCSSTCD